MDFGSALRFLASAPAKLHELIVRGKRLGAGSPFTFNAGLPAYLGGGGPGGWASNHYNESVLLTGRAFTAVRAVARTCAKARPKVMATGRRFERRMKLAAHEHRKGLLDTATYRRYKASVQEAEDGGDAVPVGPTHPLQRLMTKPNPWMTISQFLFQHGQQHCATATTLIWVRRNGWGEFDRRGVPSQLYIIPTGLTQPIPPSAEYPAGAYRVLPVGSYGGIREGADPAGDNAWTSLMLAGGVIDGRDCVPVRWPHSIFLTDGQSTMEAGKEWIDIHAQLDRATFFGLKNTLRPGYVFQMAEGFEEPTKAESDRFDREIMAAMAGVQQIGRHFRLPKGIQIADADRGVQELGWIDGRQVMANDINSLWAVHPVISGQQPPGAYAAYIAAMICFMEQAIEPPLSLLGDALQDELTPAYGGDLQLSIPAPNVNDQQQAEAELATDCQFGTRTYNEVRRKRGLEPWPEYGDMPVGTDISGAMAREHGLDPAELGIGLESGPGDANNGQHPLDGTGKPGKPSKDQPTEPPARTRGPVDRNQTAGGRPRTRMGRAGQTGPVAARKMYMPLFLPADVKLNGKH